MYRPDRPYVAGISCPIPRVLLPSEPASRHRRGLRNRRSTGSRYRSSERPSLPPPAGSRGFAWNAAGTATRKCIAALGDISRRGRCRCRAIRSARQAGGARAMIAPPLFATIHLIIGDERRKHAARCACRDAGKGEHRLAASPMARMKRRPPSVDDDRRGVDVHARPALMRLAAGGGARMKRAPSSFRRFGVDDVLRPAAMPPCASAIWRLIDSPRPEFWPKPSLIPAGRYRSAQRCGRYSRPGCPGRCPRCRRCSGSAFEPAAL